MRCKVSSFHSFKVSKPFQRGEELANTYRDLLVWQKAKDLAVSIYRVTESFPSVEQFGLTSQMRRAAISVASNIAEGQGRGSKPDFAKFLCMARGSLLELQTQLEISKELGLVRADTYEESAQQCYAILGLLNRLLQSMSSRPRV